MPWQIQAQRAIATNELGKWIGINAGSTSRPNFIGVEYVPSVERESTWQTWGYVGTYSVIPGLTESPQISFNESVIGVADRPTANWMMQLDADKLVTNFASPFNVYPWGCIVAIHPWVGIGTAKLWVYLP